MKDSNIARFLDRFAGSFICFILSFFNRVKSRKHHAEINNVLIIELFEMGASVMALPSVNYLIELLGSSNVYIFCTDSVRESWELLNLVPNRNILSVSGSDVFMFAGSVIKQVIRARKLKLDLVIDFELFMRISAIISFLSGAKSRAGFFPYGFEGLYRGDFYDIHCCYNQNNHISKNYLSLTKTALNQLQEFPNYKGRIKNEEVAAESYQPSPNLIEKIKSRVRKIYPKYVNQDLILISPDVGPVLQVRNYPVDAYVELINKLLQEYPEKLFLLIGIEENERTCSYIHRQIDNPRCVNFCGYTDSLKELMALFSISELLIGQDNGTVHFASMTQIKILALFSTDSPFVWGPLGNCVIAYSFYQCSPCICAFNHKRSRCRNNLCLQSISPDTIVLYVQQIEQGKAAYHTINNQMPYLH